ncbi:MAG: glycogen synthase GlgA [Negativicutes bacterium]|nr:glycogen synthase GlgA [Negativicutes bacterium]MDR3590731.1 glycogen synthase GlgA [Negativicutes bacterium]
MLKVLLVAAEAGPFVKSGGLGDVVGSLPKALRKLGVDARVMLPKHQAIPAGDQAKMVLRQEFTVPVGWRKQYCGLQELEHAGVPFYFLDNIYYFQRPTLYGHYDDAERFAFFCRAVLESLPYLDFFPDVIHCHDWHASMVSVFLTAHYREKPGYADIRTLFTIHNLKYQGVFPKAIMEELLGLGWEHFTADRLEFFDQVNFLKGALAYSDRINTVSPTYAGEIQNSFFGEHLDGYLGRRHTALSGIINGIDYESYDPATDPNLFCHYDSVEIAKAENKIFLQQQLGLPVSPETPMVAMVTRLVSQKGLDLVAYLLNELASLDLQLVVLGTGEDHYQDMFWYAAGRYPRKVSANICFDETLARRIYAAADLLLMPSLFEPCGIAQLIAMRYGCVPLVRETGGLKDTVAAFNEKSGEGNGFSFANYNAHDMLYTLRRALDFYRQSELWGKIVKNAMAGDYSWDKSARQYQILYETLLGEEAAHEPADHPNYGPEFTTFYGPQHSPIQSGIFGQAGKAARQNL